MDSVGIAQVVSWGLTHDADRALAKLLRTDVVEDEDESQAAAVFLRVLSCRFDDALDTALLLAARTSEPSPLVKAATDFAVAVCAGEVTADPGGARVDGPLGEFIAMLQVEAAMSSGLIATAEEIAKRASREDPLRTAFGVWCAVALTRAWGFEGRFVEADELLDRIMVTPGLASWPQMSKLAGGARIFVDGFLDRAEAVEAGLAALRLREPSAPDHDYIDAGTYALAAFGANAVGRLTEAAALILRAGGGEYLPHLQLVDRLYGYEILVEDALARHDAAAAGTWAEHAAGLPIGAHRMAGAAWGRIKARLSLSISDTEAGIRESADSGVLAALVGGDLEVFRARIIEASARAAGGDRIRGVEELEEVARRAGATGASSVKEWAERELHVHGRRLRNVPGHGWDTLSSTQQAIARLAAAGLRNREIAAALWVSDKTVESHIAAVLSALGTVNRVGIGRELGGEFVDPVFGATVTVRQREVAVLVARGLSNAEISNELGISGKTVEKHISGLFQRLGVRTRSAIAARVRGAGVTPDLHP